MRYSVDRIESGTAVLVGEHDSIDVPLNELGFEVKEGDILLKDENGFSLLKDETSEKRSENAKRTRNLFRK